MSETAFIVGDWIRPADDMYDSTWKSTKYARRITEIEEDGSILFGDSYSHRQYGRFRPSECRHATDAERELAIKVATAQKQVRDAESKLDEAKVNLKELTTTVCPTCGHRG